MNDKCGKEINVGDYIVYGTERAELKFGKIIGLNDSYDEYYRTWGYEISVLGFSEWNRTIGKKGIVRDPKKIIVLNPEQLPKQVRELFENT